MGLLPLPLPLPQRVRFYLCAHHSQWRGSLARVRYYYKIIAVYNPVIIQASVWSRWFCDGSNHTDHIWSRFCLQHHESQRV